MNSENVGEGLAPPAKKPSLPKGGWQPKADGRIVCAATTPQSFCYAKIQLPFHRGAFLYNKTGGDKPRRKIVTYLFCTVLSNLDYWK